MFISPISLHLTMTSLLPLLHHNWPFQLLYKISPLIMGRHHCVQFCYLEHEDNSIFMGRMESWQLEFHRFDSKCYLTCLALSCKGLFYAKLLLHWNIRRSFHLLCVNNVTSRNKLFSYLQQEVKNKNILLLNYLWHGLLARVIVFTALREHQIFLIYSFFLSNFPIYTILCLLIIFLSTEAHFLAIRKL